MARKEPEISATRSGPGDDFKLIHGIGPGIENRLKSAGIKTYHHLASMTPEEVSSALGNLIGLTIKRIVDQDWIGQARKLAPSRPAVQENGKANRQHYATFTIELLLDEDNNLRRTRAVYVQNEQEDTWAGWNDDRLLDFITQHAGLPERRQEITNPAEQSEWVISTPATPPLEIKEIQGNLHLEEVELASLESGHRGRLLDKDEPFEIKMAFDLGDLVVHGSTTMSYSAHLSAKALGRGTQKLLGEAHGTIGLDTPAMITVQSHGLEEGTYRMNVALALSLPEEGPESIPGLETAFDGGLVQIY